MNFNEFNLKLAQASKAYLSVLGLAPYIQVNDWKRGRALYLSNHPDYADWVPERNSTDVQIASNASIPEIKPLRSILEYKPELAEVECPYNLEEEMAKLRGNIDLALTSAGENFLGYLYRVWGEIEKEENGFGCNQQEKALFINGIYSDNGETMLRAQTEHPGLVCYAQPYGGGAINCLKKNKPSPRHPMRVYFSTTQDLRHIRYTGQIIRWEDKTTQSVERKRAAAKHLGKHQPGEVGLLKGTEQKTENARNLISVVNVSRLPTPIPLERLRKTSDGLPRKPRPQSGGFSEVYDEGALEEVEVVSLDSHQAKIERETRKAQKRSDSKLDERLSKAAAQPEKIQIVSVGFKRNPDVIAKVLRRAKGICECCGNPAPFTRVTDGTPFLDRSPPHHSSEPERPRHGRQRRSPLPQLSPGEAFWLRL